MKKKYWEVKKMQFDNRVIGFFEGKAIVMDDNCDLFYSEISSEHISIGDFVMEADLKPVSELSPQTRRNIIEKFA